MLRFFLIYLLLVSVGVHPTRMAVRKLDMDDRDLTANSKWRVDDVAGKNQPTAWEIVFNRILSDHATDPTANAMRKRFVKAPNLESIWSRLSRRRRLLELVGIVVLTKLALVFFVLVVLPNVYFLVMMNTDEMDMSGRRRRVRFPFDSLLVL